MGGAYEVTMSAWCGLVTGYRPGALRHFGPDADQVSASGTARRSGAAGAAGAMPSVQVKDVPAETYAVLRRRAAAAHQSLQEDLRQRLIEEAAMPTVEEVLQSAGGRTGGSIPFSEAVASLREDRDRR